MQLRLAETVQMPAGVDRVWSHLLDPRRVVECLPGAELTELVDDRHFNGRVKVKVGPVSASYAGRIELTEVDAAAHRMRLTAQAQEASGGGSAKVTMSATVAELATGGSELRVEATADLVGRLVQFGRATVEEVTRQLFRQFAGCLQSRLAGPAAEGQIAAGEAAALAQPATAPPVHALGLLFRALAAMLRRWLGRFHRRTPKAA